jgi:hypothetical protein
MELMDKKDSLDSIINEFANKLINFEEKYETFQKI